MPLQDADKLQVGRDRSILLLHAQEGGLFTRLLCQAGLRYAKNARQAGRNHIIIISMPGRLSKSVLDIIRGNIDRQPIIYSI